MAVGRGRSPSVAIGTAAAAVALIACSGILGLDDLHYAGAERDGGGASKGGGSSGGGSSGGDGAAAPEDGGTIGVVDAGGAGDASYAAPTAIVSGLGELKALAVDDTTLYWVSAPGSDGGGAVQSAPKGGGTVTTIAAGLTGPLDVAVDANDVYWSVSQPAASSVTSGICNAMFASKSGGGAAPTCVTQTDYSTLRMTLNDDDVVLLAQGTAAAQYVGFAPKAQALGTFKSATTPGPATMIAANDQDIFVSNQSGAHVDQLALPGLGAGPILCTTGCGTWPFVDAVIDVSALDILWAAGDGTVRIEPVGGGTAQQIGAIGALPTRIARDASYVYATAANGGVYAVPRDGSGADGGAAIVTLASGQVEPFGIAADGVNVYWATGDGKVMAVEAPQP